MLLPPNSIAFTKRHFPSLTGGTFLWLGATYWNVLEWNNTKLTSIHNLSAVILWNFFFAKEVPPFHLVKVIHLIISVLDKVELGVELGWNYMKFHPNSTHNSTINNQLIIKMITALRWKSGITNDKKYFSKKVPGNILITVKIAAF